MHAQQLSDALVDERQEFRDLADNLGIAGRVCQLERLIQRDERIAPSAEPKLLPGAKSQQP